MRALYEQYTCDCGVDCIQLPHWVSGKLAPIETTPNPKGNVEILYDIHNNQCYRIIPKTERDAGAVATLYMNHWATCKSPRFAR